MIPRPQTETLIEETLKVFPADSSPSILEIGTGSGAISVALAKELPKAFIIATDISPDALSVARENAYFHGVKSIKFIEGDLYDPIKYQRNSFDLIISNPPYIPSGEISGLPPGIRDYEPHIAIDGGSDGLEYHRKIAIGAHNYLKPGGCLLLEVGINQSERVSNIISQTGKFSPPKILKDLSNVERVVKAYKL